MEDSIKTYKLNDNEASILSDVCTSVAIFRDISFHPEETIETYFLKIGPLSAKEASFFQLLKELWKDITATFSLVKKLGAEYVKKVGEFWDAPSPGKFINLFSVIWIKEKNELSV